MSLKSWSLLVSGIIVLSLIGCAPTASSLKSVLTENPDVLASVLEKHPEVVAGAIEKNPLAFTEAMSKLALAQKERAAKDADKAREAEYSNPKKPEISETRASRGPKDAPILIVEYSDFQCPFCKKGYQVVKELEKKYEGKVRFVYKNLPLPFHPLAMPSAKYFAAISQQGAEMAYHFHDYVFENQDKLGQEKEDFLKKAARKAGADMKRLTKDLEDSKTKYEIEADMEEARKFGISGTPGFLVNGISLKGALPISEFEKIISRTMSAK